jgi:hypothetical protein
VRWFPGDAPVGQGTVMPPQQRRAGFRISIGVIAEANDAAAATGPEALTEQEELTTLAVRPDALPGGLVDENPAA